MKKIPGWAWAALGFAVWFTVAIAAAPHKPAPRTPQPAPISAAEQNHLARLKKAQDAAEALALAEQVKRGPKPVPSLGDGMTFQVQLYLRGNLNDYDSMKLMQCSTVIPFGKNAWAQRVSYRAKNAFGAYRLENQLFVIRGTEILDVIED